MYLDFYKMNYLSFFQLILTRVMIYCIIKYPSYYSSINKFIKDYINHIVLYLMMYS